MVPVTLVRIVLNVVEDVLDRTISTSPGQALRLISLIGLPKAMLAEIVRRART